MAALASSAVTVTDSYEIPSPECRVIGKVLTLVLTGEGGATNTISASTLGFSKLIRSTAFQKSDDAGIVLSAVSYDGSKLFLYSLADATDATRPAPADITGTYRGTVEGT